MESTDYQVFNDVKSFMKFINSIEQNVRIVGNLGYTDDKKKLLCVYKKEE